MSEVIERLPTREVPHISGPVRQGCAVIIEGRCVPRMHCFERESETEIVIDGRFSYTFPKDWGFLAAAMAAQAMAIGAGYSHLGAETKDGPFAPRAVELGEIIP
jgi:hypothetical protein